MKAVRAAPALPAHLTALARQAQSYLQKLLATLFGQAYLAPLAPLAPLVPLASPALLQEILS